MTDYTVLSDAELQAIAEGVAAEITQRQRATTIDQLIRDSIVHTGLVEGQPWRQPTGAHDAYPKGWTVTHNGKTYESLVVGNAWEPGTPLSVDHRLWLDLTPPDPDPPAGPQPWAAGVDYIVGDRVAFEGRTYSCRQAHTSQTGWTPAAVPALWLEE